MTPGIGMGEIYENILVLSLTLSLLVLVLSPVVYMYVVVFLSFLCFLDRTDILLPFSALLFSS
jgi:hypothetical protein